MSGAAHDHREFVAGCFRCDLSRDEVSRAPIDLDAIELRALAAHLSARQDVPALVAEVRQLREERDRLRAKVAAVEALPDRWKAPLIQMRRTPRRLGDRGARTRSQGRAVSWNHDPDTTGA